MLQLVRRLQSQPLRHLGAKADREVSLADPHPMQDTSELACYRDDRTQHARPLGDPQPPSAQARPFPYPQQKACGGLAKRLSNGDVTLLGDATFIVDGGS